MNNNKKEPDKFWFPTLLQSSNIILSDSWFNIILLDSWFNIILSDSWFNIIEKCNPKQ